MIDPKTTPDQRLEQCGHAEASAAIEAALTAEIHRRAGREVRHPIEHLEEFLDTLAHIPEQDRPHYLKGVSVAFWTHIAAGHPRSPEQPGGKFKP